jgi:hypothetical protein
MTGRLSFPGKSYWVRYLAVFGDELAEFPDVIGVVVGNYPTNRNA